MRKEAKQELNDLYQNSNSVFCFLRPTKNERKDLEGRRCLRARDKRLAFIEKGKTEIWKEHMEKIINDENKWDQTMEDNVVEGPVEKVVRNQIVEAMQKMNSGKATGPSEASVEMIVVSCEIEV